MNNYSPHLKEVMDKIKAVLKDQDLAAYVVLQEPGFSEYLLDLEPSWSAVGFVTDADNYVVGVRVRAKAEDFDSPQELRQTIEDTLNLLAHLTNVLGNHREAFLRLHELIVSTIESEHTDGVHTPHREH